MQLDALYWARRIAATRELTLKDFERYDLAWAMPQQQRKKLLGMVANNIKKRKIRKFNDSEKNFFEARRRSQWLPGPGRLDEGLIADMGREEAVELLARYWIWRIGILSELSLQDFMSCRFSYKPDFRRELAERIADLQVKGAAHSPSDGELHKLDAAMEKAARLDW